MSETDELLAELRRHQRDYPSLIHSELCGRAADAIEASRAPAPAAGDTREDWKQAAQVEAGLRREFQGEVERLRGALIEVEAVMSIVPPRNSTKEYLATLHKVRAALSPAAAPSHTPYHPHGRDGVTSSDNVGQPPAAAPARAGEAMFHLGNVLYMLADLHPDDRCDALDNAQRFYNARNPTEQIAPHEEVGPWRLVNEALATPSSTPGSGADGDGWRPIETAPKDGTRILAHTPGSARPVQEVWWARDYEGQDGYWQTPPGPAGRGYTVLPEGVEAWRPLPAPPPAAAPAQAGGEDADFVEVIGHLTNYVQNERVRAYNEGVDAGKAATPSSTPGSGADGDGWRPIETAPYGEILCWVPFSGGNGACNLLCKDGAGNWIDDNGDDIAPYKPTHWMPLPSPPLAAAPKAQTKKPADPEGSAGVKQGR